MAKIVGLILTLAVLTGCQISYSTTDGARIGFMQSIHESENTQTTQVTLFGLELAAATEGNGSPAVRLGYIRSQITSIPAYIPAKDPDGTVYAEPTVSISTDAGTTGIREKFGVGKWGEQKPVNNQ